MKTPAKTTQASSTGKKTTRKNSELTIDNVGNVEKVRKLNDLLCEVYAMSFRKGFFGTISIRLFVHDGIANSIQYSVDKQVH